MTRDVQELVMDLMLIYSTAKDQKPGVFEVYVIERALPYVKEVMEPNTYDSWVEWVERHKPEFEV